MVKLIIGLAVGFGVYYACKVLHLGPWLVDARIIGSVALGLVAMHRCR